MKLKRILLPILAWSGLILTSCHCEHEEVTELLSSLQVGNVVCSDGNILSMNKFKQSNKEAVAIVFHVNRSAETDNLGYAVYIHDMYLQLIIPQYFISNKSGIWSLSLIVHSKG